MVVKLNPALTSGHAQKFSFGNSESNASHIRVNSPVAADAFVPTATATKRGAGAFVRKLALAFMATCTTLGIGGCAKDEPVTPDTPTGVTSELVQKQYKALNTAKYGPSNLKSTGDTIALLYPSGDIIAEGSFKAPVNNKINFKEYLVQGYGAAEPYNITAEYQPNDKSFIRSTYNKFGQLISSYKEYVGPDGKAVRINLQNPSFVEQFDPYQNYILRKHVGPDYIDTLRILKKAFKSY